MRRSTSPAIHPTVLTRLRDGVRLFGRSHGFFSPARTRFIAALFWAGVLPFGLPPLAPLARDVAALALDFALPPIAPEQQEKCDGGWSVWQIGQSCFFISLEGLGGRCRQ